MPAKRNFLGLEKSVVTYHRRGASFQKEEHYKGYRVWQDENGTTWLSYNDPAFLAHRHGLGEQAKAAGAAIAAALNAIATKATTSQ